MRLSEHQRDVIRRSTAEVAGPSARVLLFGSRTRPELRGADIDLLIELAQPSPDRWALGTRLGARIERQLGLQKSTSWSPIRRRPTQPCWPPRATTVFRSERRRRPPMTANPKLRFLADTVLAEAEHLLMTDGRLFVEAMTPERAASQPAHRH